jgi:hypothetical protein
VHGEPESIAVAKAEREESARIRLEAFRSRVMAEYPIRTWTNAQELGGIVSRSISRAIKVNPRLGWVRNTGTSNLELLEQINIVTRENKELKERLSAEVNLAISVDELESGADTIVLRGYATAYDKIGLPSKTRQIEWAATASWDDIFRDVGPILMNEATEENIGAQLERYIGWSSEIDWKKYDIRRRWLSSESFAAVIVQLRALGLISKGVRKRAVSDRGSYWGLTEKGEHYLVSLLARKKVSNGNRTTDAGSRDIEIDGA